MAFLLRISILDFLSTPQTAKRRIYIVWSLKIFFLFYGELISAFCIMIKQNT